MFSWVSPNLFCLFILPFVWNIIVLWLCPVPFSIILWKFQFPFLKETLMIMRGFELFKQKGGLSQFCVLLLIKTSCVHLHHNAPYGLGSWHSAKGRGNWESSPFFKALRMALQKCHLSNVKFSRKKKSLEMCCGITDKFPHGQSSPAALTCRERVGNRKWGGFNGPWKFFSWCFIWILVFRFSCDSFFRHTILVKFIQNLQQIRRKTSYGPLIWTPSCNSEVPETLGNRPKTFTGPRFGPELTEPPSR